MRKFVMIMVVGAASLAAGCNAADEATEEEVLEDSTALTAVDHGLRGRLQDMLNGYAYALESGDTAAVEEVVSAELLSRIDQRVAGADIEGKMRSFVLREQRKLARELGEPRSRGELFTVTSARKVDDGQVVALTVSVGGKELPKPFYFVAEDGGYKLNVVQPTASLSRSTYRVKNDDSQPRNFSCSGGDGWRIAPFSELKVGCQNSCSTFAFDGTRFWVEETNGLADCDYNSWGVDMTIRNGYPVCSDPC